MCVCAQSCLILCNPVDWLSTAPLSLEFFRQEYCSRLPFSFPGDLPNPGIKPLSPTSPAHRQIVYCLNHWWNPKSQYQTSTKIFIQEVLSIYFVSGSVILTEVLKKRTDQGPASRCLYARRKIGNKQIKIYIGSGGVQWIKIKQSKGIEKGKAIWNEVAIEELSKEAHMNRGLVDINKEAVSNLWVKFDELAACFCTAQRAKGLPRWC